MEFKKEDPTQCNSALISTATVQQTWAHNQWQSHHTIIYTTGVLRLTRVDLVLAVVMLWEFENAVAESADGLERGVLRVGEVVQSQQWTAAVSKRSLQQLEYLHNACQIHADHHLANWVSANTASTISRRLLGDIQDAFFFNSRRSLRNKRYNIKMQVKFVMSINEHVITSSNECSSLRLRS